MIVLDTSAALSCLVSRSPDAALVTRVAEASSVHVPHLIDVEFVSALRGLVRGSKLTVDRARDALTDFIDLRLVRYPVTGLMLPMWARRDSLTAYDAAFVCLAEALDCPLVTCDRRLARGSSESLVELFPPND